MSRSSRATPPSRCRMSTAPRSSSWPETLGVRRRQIDAAQAQHAAHQRLDGADDRTEHRDEERDRRRDQQRHAVGIGDGDGLGQHLAEDDDQRGHDDGRVDDAAIADRRDEHAGGESRGGDGDELSAEQHRADEAPAHRDQPVDERRAPVAGHFQRVHARPRGRGQRRFRAGEERRGDEAERRSETSSDDAHAWRRLDSHASAPRRQAICRPGLDRISYAAASSDRPPESPCFRKASTLASSTSRAMKLSPMPARG